MSAMNRADAKPGLTFKDWGIRALLNTAPRRTAGWPPKAIDPSKAFKSQTRRVVNLPDYSELGECPYCPAGHVTESIVGTREGVAVGEWLWGERDYPEAGSFVLNPPYRLGQLYYAKEALYRGGVVFGRSFAAYEADDATVLHGRSHNVWWTWLGGRLNGIFMPRAAARLFYVLRGIRAEQVCGICWDDLMAEGMQDIRLPRLEYGKRFDEINGPGAWDENPYVWRYELERVEL